MLKRLITLVLYFTLFTVALFSQTPPFCPDGTLDDPLLESNFNIECHLLGSRSETRIHWNDGTDSTLGGFLFKWLENDNVLCSQYKKEIFGLTLYSDNCNPAYDGCTYVENAPERTCYQLQYFSDASACQSGKSEIKCSCPELIPSYEQVYLDMPNPIATTQGTSIPSISPCQIAGHAGFTYFGNKWLCTNRQIQYINHNQTADACTADGLSISHVAWDIEYGSSSLAHISGIQEAPYTFHSLAADDPVNPSNPWYRQCQVGNTDHHSVTATIDNLPGSSCTTVYNALQNARQIYRTPDVTATLDTDTGVDNEDGSYWGCSKCIHPTFTAGASNYIDDTEENCQTYPTFAWRHTLPQGSTTYQPWGKEESDKKYSIASIGLHTLVLQAGVNNAAVFEGHVDCFSDPLSFDVEIQESPADPIIEGPVSVCKADADQPFTLSVTNTEAFHSTYGNLMYDWRSCTDDYQRCFNEYEGADTCQIKLDTSQPEPWSVTESTSETVTIQPPYPFPDHLKRMQFYIRGIKQYDSNVEHTCFGESYYSVHFLDDCQTLPPGTWTPNNNPFFPATVTGETLPEISEGRDSDPAIAHTNLAAGTIDWNDPANLEVTGGTEYELSFTLEESARLTPAALFEATIYQYELQPDNSLIEIDKSQLDLALTILDPPSVPGDPVRIGAAFTPLAAANRIGIKFRLFNTDGLATFHTAMLVETGTTQNLLLGSDFCDASDWSFTSNPLYPGSALGCTSLFQPGESAPPLRLTLHNLATGGILSDPVAIAANPAQLRLSFAYRGEALQEGAYISARIHILDDTQSEIDLIEAWTPYQGSGSWSTKSFTYDLTTNVTYATLNIQAYHLDGWIALDQITLEQFDGANWIAVSLPNPGFEIFDEASNTLSDWHNQQDPTFPATSTFHPVYYDPFSPLTGDNPFLPWGPVKGYGGGYAFSISNQMFGASTQSFTVDEYVEYEVSAWMRGGLLESDPVYSAELSPRIHIRSVGTDGIERFATTHTLTRADLTANWHQFRTNVSALAGDTVEITLLSPYLSGWLAFDEIRFGKYNRPPTIQAGDARYIPNQEQNPSIFGSSALIEDIEISYQVSDPDESDTYLDPDIKSTNCLEGDCDEFTGAPSCFSSGSLRSVDSESFLITPDCGINQESKVVVELEVTDPENPDQLSNRDIGSLILEPFWGLNAGFENSIDDDTPVYWSMDDDPRFPATSTAYQGDQTLPFAGANAAMKGNVATGFVKSYDFLLTGPAEYRLRVYSKGLATIGAGKMGVHLTYSGTTDVVNEARAVYPSPGQWEDQDLYFIIPDGVTASAMVYFGVEGFAGWILYDTSSLYKKDEATEEYTIYVAEYMDADPGFEETPNAGLTPNWDYRAVEHEEFPATAVEWYHFPQTSSPLGIDPNPAGVGNSGAIFDYATLSSHGLFFTNEFDTHARQNVCYKKETSFNYSISFDYAYEVLDRFADHNGSLDLILSYYPVGGLGSAGEQTIKIPLTNSSSDGWIHEVRTLQGVTSAVDMMKYAFDLHHAHGWVAIDNIQISGFTIDHLGPCWGSAPPQTGCGPRTDNGSFEYYYDSNGKQYPCNWLLEIPDYPGTGAFVADSLEDLLFNRTNGLYYDASQGQRYLVITNLAKGTVKGERHAITGGVEYDYDYWYHCQSTDAFGEGGNRLRYYDAANASLGEEEALALFDSAVHIGSGLFSHPSAGEEGSFDFSYYVNLLEGYCSFDDLILKPQTHTSITPDPFFFTPHLSCTNDYLGAGQGKENYQWYLSNQKIPAPEGTSYQVMTTRSGNYSVEYKEDISTVLGFAEPVQVELAPQISGVSPFLPYCSVLSGASNTYSMQALFGKIPNDITSCQFNWGDGTTSSTLPTRLNNCSANHTYMLQLGNNVYTLTMSVIAENGCNDSVTRTLVIQPNYGFPIPNYDPPLCFFVFPFPIHNHPFGVSSDDILDIYNNGDFATQMMLKALIVKRTAMGEYLAFNETSIDQFYARRSELEDLGFPEVMVRFEENGIPLSDKDLRMQTYISDKEREREVYDPASDYEDDYDYYGFTPDYCANQTITVENEEELLAYVTDFGWDGTNVYNLDVKFNPTGNVEIHSPCAVKLSGHNGSLQIDAQKVRVFGRNGVELIAGVNQSIRSAGKIVMISEFSEIIIPPGMLLEGEELHLESPIDVNIGQNTTVNISGTARILLTGSENKSEAAIQQNAAFYAGELILKSANEAVVGAAASVHVVGNFHMEAADPSKCSISNSAEITAGSTSGNCWEVKK